MSLSPKKLTNLTPDISEYVEFQFYGYCFYWDTPQSYPHEKKHIGRWLGVAHHVGQAMVFWVMNANGKKYIQKYIHTSGSI